MSMGKLTMTNGEADCKKKESWSFTILFSFIKIVSQVDNALRNMKVSLSLMQGNLHLPSTNASTPTSFFERWILMTGITYITVNLKEAKNLIKF